MKKLLILVISIVVLALIYVYVLPLLGIDTKSPMSIKGPPSHTVGPDGRVPPKITEKSDIEKLKEQDKIETKVDIVLSGVVMGTKAHVAKGEVRIVEIVGANALAYSGVEFESEVGQHVFLSKTLAVSPDSIDLGPVTSAKGNAFYRIPTNTEVDKYSYVIVVGKDRRELFNYAKVSNK